MTIYAFAAHAVSESGPPEESGVFAGDSLDIFAWAFAGLFFVTTLVLIAVRQRLAKRRRDSVRSMQERMKRAPAEETLEA